MEVLNLMMATPLYLVNNSILSQAGQMGQTEFDCTLKAQLEEK